MNNILTIIGLTFLVLFLFGCTPSEGEQGGIAEVAALAVTDDATLSDVARLALGSVQLEETELSIDAAQAETLLPLWQAVQTLGQSETTAVAELDALASQIEGVMQPSQIEAIAAMDLSLELLGAQQPVAGFGGRGQGGNGTPSEGAPAAGSGQGGLGQGGPGGGGAGGPGGGQLNEEAIATRQAQFDNSSLGAQDLRLTGTVVRLLEQKLGQGGPANNRQVANVVLTAVSESTGLLLEEIQAELAEGVTLTGVIADAGGDVAAVETAVREALADLPNGDQLDVEQIVSNWFDPSE